MSQPVSIPAAFDDWCTLAQRRLPNFLFGYVDGGSLDEHTLRANVSAWRQVHLRQHVQRDVSACQSGIRFFGVDARMPLALAPVGLGGVLRRRGEVQHAGLHRGPGRRAPWHGRRWWCGCGAAPPGLGGCASALGLGRGAAAHHRSLGWAWPIWPP